jgi:hypothetical protein
MQKTTLEYWIQVLPSFHAFESINGKILVNEHFYMSIGQQIVL